MIAKGEKDLNRDQLVSRLEAMAARDAAVMDLDSARHDSNAGSAGSATQAEEHTKSQDGEQAPKTRRVVKKRVKKRRKKIASAAKEGKLKKRSVTVSPPDHRIEIDEIGYLGPQEDLADIRELAAKAGAEFQRDAGTVEPSGTSQAENAHRVQPSKDESSRAVDDPIAKLRQLVARAKHGDEQAIVGIRRILDEHPQIWQSVGDLASHCEMLLINVIADGNEMVAESLKREIARLKAELTEGEPSPLEKLTLQRVVAAWLHAQHVDRLTLAADAVGSKSAAWGKRQESAERKFQVALKSLDLVRRLKPRKQLRDPLKDSVAKALPDVTHDKSVDDAHNGNGSDTLLNGADVGADTKQPIERNNGHSVNRIRALSVGKKVPAA